MLELCLRRRLERDGAAALRVDAGEDLADGTVLAGGVEALENEQQRTAVFRPQTGLIVRELGEQRVEPLLRLGLAG